MKDEKIKFLTENGVDVNKGIESTMDFETYDEILLEFCDTFKEDVNKFNNFKLAGDMYNYEIIVHALKSNCRTLGINSLSELAYNHEMKGKENDINYINANINSLFAKANEIYLINDSFFKEHGGN